MLIFNYLRNFIAEAMGRSANLRGETTGIAGNEPTPLAGMPSTLPLFKFERWSYPSRAIAILNEDD
jgi:hypothetical protein